MVLYLIDGLQPPSAKLMAANGAVNLKMIYDSGVVADTSYSPYPKEGYTIEGGKQPWGKTSPGNVAVHNGCHLFESKNVDDIFLAAREKGIKSVYAGGTPNYAEITTPDYHLAGDISDEAVVQFGIDHFKNDKARLIRLHPQRVRDGWTGPAGIPDPASSYNKAILVADAQLGRLIAALKTAGIWDSTLLMVAADHGMNDNPISLHDADQITSWDPFIGFYGPGVKKGATIPYAELSDLAIMADSFLGLRPLKGVLDPAVTITPKEPTGTFLSNIFVGAPRDVSHPHYVLKFLKSVNMKPKADYISYRNAMLPILKANTSIGRRMGSGGKISVRSLPERGGLSITAPFVFDRVDIVRADGKTRLSIPVPAAASARLPGLSLDNAGDVVRLHKPDGAVLEAALF
ncbi:MAG TPA: alkaline phosphatase family protein [Fibrobacteria bacterium]|nr:alkaline phosphatase family protein [Fibrobacteria bacterium]